MIRLKLKWLPANDKQQTKDQIVVSMQHHYNRAWQRKKFTWMKHTHTQKHVNQFTFQQSWLKRIFCNHIDVTFCSFSHIMIPFSCFILRTKHSLAIINGLLRDLVFCCFKNSYSCRKKTCVDTIRLRYGPAIYLNKSFILSFPLFFVCISPYFHVDLILFFSIRCSSSLIYISFFPFFLLIHSIQ